MLPRCFFLYLTIFLSGFCSLSYELLWSRFAQIDLGTSSLAISAILASFMLGFSGGSFASGRISWIRKNPLISYGLIECGIGIYALLLPDIVALIRTHSSSHLILRYILTLVTYLPATLLMGSTVPTLQYFFYTHSSAARLYSFNTGGAAIGIFFLTFILLPYFPLSALNHGVAFLNLMIGLAIFIFFNRIRNRDISKKDEDKMDCLLASCVQSHDRPKFLLFLLFLSGVMTMVYEIAGARLLTLIYGSSIYGFSLVLWVLMSGLSLGSFLYHTLSKKIPNPLLIWGSQIGIVLSSLLILNCADQLPFLFYRLYQDWNNSFPAVTLIQGILGSMCLLPIATFTGLCFAALIFLAQSHFSIGTLFSINALGNALGAVMTSLIFVPMLGLERVFELSICIFIAAVLLTLYRLRLRNTYLAILSVVLGLSLFLIPQWNMKILTSGVALDSEKYRGQAIDTKKLQQALHQSQILFSKDGWTSQVTVRQFENIRGLLINGKADGSDGQDVQTQLLVAHIPLLIHPQPRSVFVLGLGTGITLNAVTKYPVQKIVCAEIEKRVLEASHFFRHRNEEALQDPRLQCVMDDARHVLETRSEKFDCIISEPSNPWLAGIGSLYTQEMFEIIRARLKPNGVVCQWIHYYHLSTGDLKTVVRTFQSVFPNATLWGQPHLSDLWLVATKNDHEIPNPLYPIPQEAQKNLSSIGLHSIEILSALKILNSQEVRSFAGQGLVNSDNRPILEFSAPKSLYLNTYAENLRELLTHRVKRTIPTELAMTYFLKAMLSFYEDSSDRHHSSLHLAMDHFSEWPALRQFYETSAIKTAERHFQKGHDQKSTEILEHALNLLRNSPKISYSLGFFYQSKKEWDQAANLYQKTIEDDPQFFQAYNNLGTIYLETGQWDKAYQHLRKALDLNPQYDEAHINLAYVLMKQKAWEGAELEFKECIHRNLQPSTAYNGLGVIEAIKGNSAQAIYYFEKALEIDPFNEEALRNLKKQGGEKQTKQITGE